MQGVDCRKYLKQIEALFDTWKRYGGFELNSDKNMPI